MNFMDNKIEHLYSKIKYVFKDPTLLTKVLKRIELITTEDTDTIKCFERLELLGDAVLNMIVSDMLFRYFPNEPGGVLSRIKANLVCSKTLVNVSKALGLPMFLKASIREGEINNILENGVEALIGAVYVDGGLDSAKSFIVSEWYEKMKNSNIYEQSYKIALQNWTRKNGKPLPKYFLIETNGRAHDLRFKTSVSVKGVGRSYAVGNTIKEAESNAASLLLNKINNIGKTGAGFNNGH